MNRWLRWTSWGWDQPQDRLEVRELARRSQLLSWIVLALLVADALLVPIGIGDVGTTVGVLIVFLSLVAAIFLNRRGLVSAAGILPVVLICVADMLSLLSQPGGLSVDALPAYDLLCTAVVVAASVLRPGAAFLVAGGNICLIIGDFFTQQHANDLRADIISYGDQTVGIITLLSRPIALEIILAVIAFLWVRGATNAIRRADRAEELAQLQAIIVEQKRQLDMGIAEMLRVHTQAANGDFHARVQTLTRDHALWQLAMSLNNLLARIQRAGMAEYQLARTEQELARLEGAVEDLAAHRRPVWPQPSGTPADRLAVMLGRLLGQGARQQLPGNQPYPGSQQVPVAPPFPSSQQFAGPQPNSQPRGRGAEPWDPRRGGPTSGTGGFAPPPPLRPMEPPGQSGPSGTSGLSGPSGPSFSDRDGYPSPYVPPAHLDETQE